MKPRSTLEQIHLQKLNNDSRQIKTPIRYENTKQEVFVYQAGELVEYIDTRVINETNDRLVNLAEKPYKI